MSANDWGGRTRGGIIWSNATFVLARAVGFLSLLVLARLLAPSEFGVVAAITLYIFVVELISDVGMRATVIYEQEEAFTRRVDTAFTINVGLALLLTVAGVLLAPLVAGFFRFEGETDLFRLAALNPLLKGFGNIHDALLMRGMNFRRRAIPELVQAVGRTAASVTLAFAGLGAAALVYGLLIGTLLWAAAHWLLSPYRPRPNLDRGIARSMVGYGTAASLVDIIAAIASRVDLAVVGRVLGDRALGLYTIAFRVPELVIEGVAWNTGAAAFPALSRKRRDDRAGLAEATRTIVRYQALYVVPMAVWLAIVAPALIVVLFSSAWADAGGVGSAVAVLAGVTAVSFPLGDAFKALGKQRRLVAIQLAQVPLFLGAILLAAPAGIVAVAWARAGSGVLHSTILWLVVSRTLREAPSSFLTVLRPAVLAGVGTGVGAGAVRLLWNDHLLLSLVASTAAGAAGAAVAMLAFAPDTLREVRQLVAAIRAQRRAEPPEESEPAQASDLAERAAPATGTPPP